MTVTVAVAVAVGPRIQRREWIRLWLSIWSEQSTAVMGRAEFDWYAADMLGGSSMIVAASRTSKQTLYMRASNLTASTDKYETRTPMVTRSAASRSGPQYYATIGS